jgi:nucleoside-diphosphate-sugar epimerase
MSGDGMPKIALVGANGQVGAELCLLLSRIADIELVPICRNPTGSAFLRYSGIACRHGRPADPAEAAQLFGDCDVIINCALGSGTPSEIRRFDRLLVHNIFKFSRPQATVIHFSTLMVYGDPRAGKLLRGRDAYGRAKRAAERRVFAESRRARKPGYILRLGHVCGPLQNITDKIRKEIATDTVVLPERDLPSNTVYTATIVDAIQAIMAGKEQPGAFDLTNFPQWSWRQVYQYESVACGRPFAPRFAPGTQHQAYPKLLVASAKRSLSRWARAPYTRQIIERGLRLAPSAVNDRAQAAWFKMRASAEINMIAAEPIPAPELSWVRLDRHALTSLQSTERLLAGDPYRDLEVNIKNRWPGDLRLHAAAPEAELEQAT